jgi:exopolyphosphatase / guanosine-5'-triphosphate,3'-diphosphate pyrophosphatase
VTRVGVVDVGTNSTRLLVADVEDGRVRPLARVSQVTRLGQDLGRTGRLADEARARVLRVLDEYAATMEEHGVERTTGVLTSAVRDAENGPAFLAEVEERYGLGARTLSGEQEAALTFRGATAAGDRGEDVVAVVDVGGGSTEVVIGTHGKVDFSVSLQAGVVRHTERFLGHDPAEPGEVDAVAADVRRLLGEALPDHHAVARVQRVIGVAGTATSVAAMDLALDPYDPDAVEGHRARTATVEALRDRMRALTEEERRKVTGLHPDRAPTIVAGLTILLEAVRALGADVLEVSERDILHGAALELAE